MRPGIDERIIGNLTFLQATPPPLTEERIRGIEASGSKHLRAMYECRLCKDSVKAYCALSRNPELEAQRFIWYKNLPDLFACGCGKTKHSLQGMRENLHGLLGLPPFDKIPIWSTEYEKTALQLTCERFGELLDGSPNEEDVQKFIEQNTTLLAPFSPQFLYFKKPVTTKYVTDLAFINGKRELVLVELERPSIKLMRKDGSIAAELQHAMGQVDDWLLAADLNRQAVLDCFDLSAGEVASISGLVIAGRDKSCSEKQLMKLQWQAHGNKKIMTYDELLRNVVALARQMSSL